MRNLVAILTTAGLVAGVCTAHARDRRHDEVGDAVRRGEALPISRIIAIVGPRLGEILEIELDDDDGNIVYEIRYLDRSGRRMEAEIDARTGRILSTEDDD